MFGYNRRVHDLRSGGYFIENPEKPTRREIKNTIAAQGGTLWLRAIFRGEATVPGSYYLGLSNAAYTFDSATVTLLAAGEPVGNGYARQQLHANTSDWTVTEVNGVLQAQSKIVTFTCSGSNWTIAYTRMFLADSASGNSGNIYAVSGPTPSPRTVLVGAGPSVQYNFWLRG